MNEEALERLRARLAEAWELVPEAERRNLLSDLAEGRISGLVAYPEPSGFVTFAVGSVVVLRLHRSELGGDLTGTDLLRG